MKNIKRKPLVITIGSILILLVLVIIWLFTTRPSDNSYATLSSTISDSQKTASSITSNLSLIVAPSLIDQKFVDTYSQYSAKFSSSVDTIKKSSVTTQDSQIKTVFESQKNTLQSYITANQNLVSSMKLYLATSTACTKMGYNLDTLHAKGSSLTTELFDTNSKDCQNAVVAGLSAPDKQFNSQFFTGYLTNMVILINAYRQEFTTGSNATAVKSAAASVEAAWNNVLAINGAKLDLTRTPDPKNSLNALSTVVASQKSAFIR